jgi:hypothetical protein
VGAPCRVVGGAEACMRGGRGRGSGTSTLVAVVSGRSGVLCQRQALTGTESGGGLWGCRGVAHRPRRAAVDDRRRHSRRSGDCGTGSRKQRNSRQAGRTAPMLPSGRLCALARPRHAGRPRGQERPGVDSPARQWRWRPAARLEQLERASTEARGRRSRGGRGPRTGEQTRGRGRGLVAPVCLFDGWRARRTGCRTGRAGQAGRQAEAVGAGGGRSSKGASAGCGRAGGSVCGTAFRRVQERMWVVAEGDVEVGEGSLSVSALAVGR